MPKKHFVPLSDCRTHCSQNYNTKEDDMSKKRKGDETSDINDDKQSTQTAANEIGSAAPSVLSEVKKRLSKPVTAR
nr:hypothetical protein [Psychrobacter sp. PraFG1]UNK06216.1 hypothetical protein MN210_06430 [Psychrobacter sp. PraFG1]